MNSKIDWSKAPEGATHWGPAVGGYCEAWVKSDMVGWLCLPTSGGAGWIRERRLISDLVERPISEYQSLWNGEGLPPVGTVCEGNEYGEWVKLEVIAHYEGRAVCMLPCKERVALADPGMLRPIRTAEQIAAEDREKDVAEMQSHFKFNVGQQETLRAICFALYDAGYRKTEQEHGHD